MTAAHVEPNVAQGERLAALQRASDLAAAWQSYKADKTPGQLVAVEVRMEELIEHLLREFYQEVTKEEVDDYFYRDVDWLDPNNLKSVPDRLVPAVIMRDILSRHRILLPSPKNVTNWSSFMKTYGYLILGIPRPNT